MANLKEVRTRIASTKSTQQITKAMKLVSATKLRKAQQAIVQMRPYAEKLQSILGNLSGSADGDIAKKYFNAPKFENVLLIVVTSDRGLCGPFNANVIKNTKLQLETVFKNVNHKNITLSFIGKKGFEAFKNTNYNLDSRYKELFQDLNSDKVFEMGNEIISAYMSNKYQEVRVIYNQFKNAATQVVKDELVLPVDINNIKGKVSKQDYIFEPQKEELLGELIPRAIKTQLFKAVLDSSASEHGARMVAMEKATENAGDLLNRLKLAYNQARQAAITTEISEIVGGAAAMA